VEDQFALPVLIVDDEGSVRSIMRRSLERVGYTNIGEADSVPAARRMLSRNGQPALVLLDLHMPGENGMVLLQELAPLAPETMIVMITGMADSQTAIDALKGGACDFLLKPMRPDAIQLAAGRALRKRRLELSEREMQRATEEMVAARTATLEATRGALLMALCQMAEFRDPETGAHLHRVPAYARILADDMARNSVYAPAITSEFIERLVVSAPLHDIGKVSVPDVVLLKPGPLSPDEFEQIKLHTVKGYNICSTVKSCLGQEKSTFIDMAMEITYGHHECWDGSGYPEGRRGMDIPLSSRIVKVADYYDACRSQRIYRPEAVPLETVIAMISEQSGQQFDPAVADSFMRCRGKFAEVEAQYGY